MSKAKTSRPESSATNVLPLNAFDKLYWLRAGFAALAGAISASVVNTDYTSGISLGLLMYLISFYLAKFTWYRSLGKDQQMKIYTTGIGTFVLVFLFTWIIIFTVQHSGYTV